MTYANRYYLERTSILVHARQECDLTVAETAIRTGLSVATIEKIESAAKFGPRFDVDEDIIWKYLDAKILTRREAGYACFGLWVDPQYLEDDRAASLLAASDPRTNVPVAN